MQPSRMPRALWHGLDVGVSCVPVCRLLIRIRDTAQGRLTEIPTDQLQAAGRAGVGESAWDGNRWRAREVGRHREALDARQRRIKPGADHRERVEELAT